MAVRKTLVFFDNFHKKAHNLLQFPAEQSHQIKFYPQKTIV